MTYLTKQGQKSQQKAWKQQKQQEQQKEQQTLKAEKSEEILGWKTRPHQAQVDSSTQYSCHQVLGSYIYTPWQQQNPQKQQKQQHPLTS